MINIHIKGIGTYWGFKIIRPIPIIVNEILKRIFINIGFAQLEIEIWNELKVEIPIKPRE